MKMNNIEHEWKGEDEVEFAPEVHTTRSIEKKCGVGTPRVRIPRSASTLFRICAHVRCVFTIALAT